ncbi:ClpP/crotonase [Basidiobolus meristosporus CBS 931.73]|uniref:3-hydroxyisobutyryl-CoA hydrolase n=1 Tax=Basidiobolus meristosporus CBS 931.73 TaxID=1314790 RepID=A0A1Y1XSH5_9FUNG|nr:ClpP/crotonase [Basidiobolus meristosporus CBS 931.73]|eukprot:ORX88709.1 ClpP/crotonase [Basidiobolus meristosporus CBS 931.73]
MLRASLLNHLGKGPSPVRVLSARAPALPQVERSYSTISPRQNEVIQQKLYGGRTFVLNRPKVLNSLNLPMIRQIYPQLQAWDQSELCKVILMKSNSPKAYCAGGDVVDVIKKAQNKDPGALKFFEEEYRLNYTLATLKTPFVALINGITMGGGVGLSVHAPFRIATENTLFAMPETKIGFLPDVGGSFFLPRLDGETGTYLALTGDRLKGEDTLYAGIATHYVPAARLDALEERLCELDTSDPEVINLAIEDFVSEPTGHEYSLAKHRNVIDKCFAHDTVEEIFESLEKENTDFTKKTLNTLNEMSPTSLKVTLRALRSGRKMNIANCFKMEYHLVQSFLAEHDFTEGVTKALITKTRDPKWSPSTISGVSDQLIEQKYFGANHAHSLELPEALPYLEYPHRRMALPSEEEIRKLLTGENLESGTVQMDQQGIVEWFLSDRQGKHGVVEKVQETLSRKTRSVLGGLRWIN